MELFGTGRVRAGRIAFNLLVALLATGCVASSAEITSPRLAQHHSGGGGSGGTTCNADTDCHARVPAPRVCPGGGTSVATACCRMNYCGVCWSDCPAAGAHATSPDAPSTTLL